MKRRKTKKKQVKADLIHHLLIIPNQPMIITITITIILLNKTLLAFSLPPLMGNLELKLMGREIPQRSNHSTIEFQMQSRYNHNEDPSSGLERRRGQALYRANELGDIHAADDFIAGELGPSPETAIPIYTYSNERPITAQDMQHRNKIIPASSIYAPLVKVNTDIHREMFGSVVHDINPPYIMTQNSKTILNVGRPNHRIINNQAIKILDAPELQDDFYLNLVDWGSNNVLAVGLGTCVYLWNATSSKVEKLCDLHDEHITSVSWAQKQEGTSRNLIAVGTNRANLYLYDAKSLKKIRAWANHIGRVGSLSWNNNILTSGSRDCSIFHHDVRSPDEYFRKLTSHSQEVCGLKWNPDGKHLASGGNDNKLMIWDSHQNRAIHSFEDHLAAVKAISWSPWDSGILVSGGGTADKTIKFYNTRSGNLIASHNINSQVCNVLWSTRTKEIISSHGYSNSNATESNQVIVWDAKSLTNIQPIVHLGGHTSRVLYMSMGDQDTTVVTGAGDETLRFWKVFDVERPKKEILNRSTVLR
ncbi:WD40-repeat-containing domain protein [Cunninghamella echinulata]|nr:WD40-repeat-containing domain protein [Cunninghamella echinulata]